MQLTAGTQYVPQTLKELRDIKRRYRLKEADIEP
jgi:hypothetical protein